MREHFFEMFDIPKDIVEVDKFLVIQIFKQIKGYDAPFDGSLFYGTTICHGQKPVSILNRKPIQV